MTDNAKKPQPPRRVWIRFDDNGVPWSADLNRECAEDETLGGGRERATYIAGPYVIVPAPRKVRGKGKRRR